MTRIDVAPRRSPLHAEHEARGATFTDFGGWAMPVRYASDLAEHHAVRTGAGVFDISHMAEFRVRGSGAADYLDAALTLDATALRDRRAKYALLLTPDGGVIDDLIVYRLARDEYLVVANAGNRAPVWAALRARQGAHDVHIVDETESTALVAVQGPDAEAVLAATAELDVPGLSDIAFYACAPGSYRQLPLMVARTGYTGEDGFELYVPAPVAVALWRALLATDLSPVPCGLAARDTLRLEAGMPLYGHELGTEIQPAQAGLGATLPLTTKSADFVGRAAVEAGPSAHARTLVGLSSQGRRAGREGYPVRLADGTEVGRVTSGALSPTLGYPIAMAYVDPGVGDELTIDVRGSILPARVTTLPFYTRQRGER